MSETTPATVSSSADASSSAIAADDESIWRAVAGMGVLIPQPLSYAYYFPEGHSEQLKEDHSLRGEKSFYLCKVISADFRYQAVTESPFVEFRLEPVSNWYTTAGGAEPDSDLVSCTKVLLDSDVKGQLELPIHMNRILPSIIMEQCQEAPDRTQNRYGNVEILHHMKGIDGNVWSFRRRSDANNQRRQFLSHGWRNFVNTKNLLPGDSIVFMKKKSSGDMFIAVRKPRPIERKIPTKEDLPAIRKALRGEGTFSVREDLSAIEEAMKGGILYVRYFPLLSPPFVIPAELVVKLADYPWRRGLQVSVDVEINNEVQKAYGFVKYVHWQTTGWKKWPCSPWKMIWVYWYQQPKEVRDKFSPWELEVDNPTITYGPIDGPILGRKRDGADEADGCPDSESNKRCKIDAST